MAAAGLSAVAIALMIVSTVLFAPAPRSANPPLLEATIAALLGGTALYVALRLSTRKVEVQQVAAHAMTGGRAVSQIPQTAHGDDAQKSLSRDRLWSDKYLPIRRHKMPLNFGCRPL